MLNIEKQIQYWINGSNEDLITSEIFLVLEIFTQTKEFHQWLMKKL